MRQQKGEYKLDKAKDWIDCVISFEELQAFLDARDINVTVLGETALDNASFYGRIFAKSGGIAQGMADVAKAMGIEGVRPVKMDGLEQCKIGLTKQNSAEATEISMRAWLAWAAVSTVRCV